MRPSPLFVSLTLGIWLGIYAMRSYVPSAVWNLADELPLDLKAMLAVGTQLIGMLGVVLVIKLRRRVLTPLACSFAVVAAARQFFIASDQIGPWLSLLSWVLWLWFMAALADEVAAHDAEAAVAPAFAAAIGLQLGMQAAWHGLDLQSVSGPVAIGTSVLLSVLLCAGVARIPRVQLPRPHTSAVWLLLGPALFLAMTLAANVGRVGQVTGIELPVVTIVLQAALLLAVAIASRATSFAVRVVFIVIGFVAVFTVAHTNGAIAFTVLAVPVVVVCGLREAADLRIRISGAAASIVGASLLFTLIFVFYNYYELPALWIAAFAPFAITAALAQRVGAAPERYLALPFGAGILLTALYLIPPPARPAAATPADELVVLSYNIHHGFNDDGVPGMSRTASEIAGMNADVVALQEIGRGWTLVGGNDVVAYLKWRFPDYHVFFAPTNGQLWGNAIMSRLPVSDATGGVFQAAPGIFRYGWSRVTVEHAGIRFPFYSVHLTADLEGTPGDTRTSQAGALLDVVAGSSPLLVAGDFNAHPEDPPIQLLRTALRDLGAAAGLGELRTWPAGRPNERIDYVFARGFSARAGSIPRTTASDHLPVLVRVRAGNTTTDRPSSSNRSSQPGANP